MMESALRADLFRLLPSVDELLRNPELADSIRRDGHVAVTAAARDALEALRNEIRSRQFDAAAVKLAVSGLPAAIVRRLRESLQFSLRAVINATGVILHTNLGRAPIAPQAIEHVRNSASRYSNLEFDLSSGERGRRDVHVDRLFRKLFAEELGLPARLKTSAGNEESTGSTLEPIATIVVNNNAAAVLIALNTLAEGGEVVVSRGELVEIGGSFRIPDVMSKSNAILREVGTTNRTRISDYEKAINERTRLFLRVHRSNFQITGFTEQPSLSELVELSRRRKIPIMEDLGSGALIDLSSVGLNEETGVIDSLRAGVDVVTYSGDKLLGGPQAGLLSGKQELISRIRTNPLFRAVRVDKLIYAALQATLLAYVKHDHDSIPAIRMMRLAKRDIAHRAEAVASRMRSRAIAVDLLDGESVVGGGAAPSSVLPTMLLAITCASLSANELEARLRSSDPPVIARVEEGRVLLDLRTVFPEQDEEIVSAVRTMAAQ
jgi:L-seryl-tRNA(Ser) seleniumtransferase